MHVPRSWCPHGIHTTTCTTSTSRTIRTSSSTSTTGSTSRDITSCGVTRECYPICMKIVGFCIVVLYPEVPNIKFPRFLGEPFRCLLQLLWLHCPSDLQRRRPAVDLKAKIRRKRLKRQGQNSQMLKTGMRQGHGRA